MDYQGNYFPEERDENESKIYRFVKTTIKGIMYGISFLIYAIIIFVLIINRDSKILEKNFMDELPEFENVDTDDIDLKRIHAKVFMTQDGSIQLHNIDYAQEQGILEIGVKYNAKKATDGERGDCVEYVLTDTDGNRYPRGKHIIDSNGRYEFARICFTGLDIDLNENNLKNEDPNPNGRGKLYTLTLVRKSDGVELFTFDIYDNTVTFSSTDYEE